jgi:SAM-dependent methyltransferase
MSAQRVEKKKLPSTSEKIVEAVKERYGAIAAESGTGCCGPQPSCCGTSSASVATRIGYTPEDLELLPDGANLGLGCGAPVDSLELKQGERVLDLGSGAGIDALIAARQVGADGHVIGVDMTPEMLASARANAAGGGYENVEFRKGRLESLPVEDSSVDAVTSNCVINLVPDKAAVFQEVARVLRPGGRLVISDIVLDGPLPDAVSSDLLAYVGCVAGAMQREAYFEALADAGLSGVEIIKDVDFLAVVGDQLPAEVAELAATSGVSPDTVRGLVHSVTYRAWKE